MRRSGGTLCKDRGVSDDMIEHVIEKRRTRLDPAMCAERLRSDPENECRRVTMPGKKGRQCQRVGQARYLMLGKPVTNAPKFKRQIIDGQSPQRPISNVIAK